MAEVITTETMALENNSVKCFPSHHKYSGYAYILLSTNNMVLFFNLNLYRISSSDKYV